MRRLPAVRRRSPALKYSTLTATEVRMLETKSSSVTIFAATSSKENGTPALIVCYSSAVKATREILLPKFISRTQAEVGAIQLAIWYAEANTIEIFYRLRHQRRQSSSKQSTSIQ